MALQKEHFRRGVCVPLTQSYRKTVVYEVGGGYNIDIYTLLEECKCMGQSKYKTGKSYGGSKFGCGTNFMPNSITLQPLDSAIIISTIMNSPHTSIITQPSQQIQFIPTG